MENEIEASAVLGSEVTELKRTIGSLNVDSGEDNILGLLDLKIGLEAVGDNVIVLVDSYKSGYECTTCGGTGKLKKITRCVCDPDIPDTQLDFPRGTRNRFNAPCENCQGEYQSKRSEIIVECADCHGKGSKLFIPETAQSLPTTGVILSVGPDVTRGGIKKNIRVVCGPYSGTFLPMRGNIPVKVYREHEPLCVLYNLKEDGTSDKENPGELASNKFIEFDVPLAERNNA